MCVARLREVLPSELDRHFGRVCFSLVRNERIERSGIELAKMLHQSLALVILHSRQPLKLGFGGADVDAVLENNLNLAPQGDYEFAAAST